MGKERSASCQFRYAILWDVPIEVPAGPRNAIVLFRGEVNTRINLLSPINARQ